MDKVTYYTTKTVPQNSYDFKYNLQYWPDEDRLTIHDELYNARVHIKVSDLENVLKEIKKINGQVKN